MMNYVHSASQSILHFRRVVVFYSFILLAATIAVSSCGSRTISGKGKIIQQNREITGNFTVINIEAPADVTISVDPNAMPHLVLHGYENILNEVRTDITANVLRIKFPHSLTLNTNGNLSADITVNSLASLEIHGGADVVVEGAVKGASLKVNLTGAGQISAAYVEVQQLECKISGVGALHIDSGRVNQAIYVISGAGNIDVGKVIANDVEAKVSGAGNILVYANNSLNARVSGAGNIEYKGSPTIQSKASGIGSITAAD